MAIENKKEDEFVITGDMLIGDIIRRKPQAIDTLLRVGMGCIACPSSLMESVEEAAMVHGLDTEYLLEKLNN
ncbi:MAG: DUF1858 domain-containing protein [Peptoniphilaceae bacterium]|nr:DUF1858 domain-containing protein [Peptoniphilaceae bacterium]MDD7382787.1 DUF1858 domain-containing protein [Peptoniphilaceae bacterium]MDY3737943.1 DUF1858 domain-containing protein [Peptoniphilaceae bacterium]